MNTRTASALAAAVLALTPASAHADRVFTEDGRMITPKKARAEGEGYRLTFEHGEIVLTNTDRVKAVEIEGDMSDYVPQNDDERDKLDKGYVRYHGKWMSKPAYQAQLNREFEAAKERADLIAAHSEWHNCWTEETKHFLVKSNTSPEVLEFYCELLEAYYKLMNKRIGIKPTPTYRRKKMTVNVYRSREEFHKLNAAGVGGSVLGYFWSHDDTLNFFHEFSEPAMSEWVALHECTHLLTFLIDQQYQPQIWLNEAVADYFGSADVERDKRGRITITPGKLQTDRVLTVQQAIKDGKDTKLTELFFIDRGNFNGFQYAHAWSFVYFLNNYSKGKYEKGFWKFFKDLYTRQKGIEYETVPAAGKTGTGYRASPKDIRDSMLKRIGVKDIEALETQWKEFVAAIPIDTPGARLKRGLRSVGRFDMKEIDKAIEDLTAAIDAGVSDPRAWAARGRALARKGRADDGIADLGEAIARDPLNASFRHELSQLMAGERFTSTSGGGIRFEISGGSDKKLDDPAAKAQAGLAMELDPENDQIRKWYERFE
ncbi:MAG TPA: hypothetical protein QF764_16505 [Planctomycetota bacterium]|nr:hypothetical protein [Planctomycetota bacterium]